VRKRAGSDVRTSGRYSSPGAPSPEGKSAIYARRVWRTWAANLFVLALPIFFYTAWPYAHCMLEVRHAHAEGRDRSPGFNPMEYDRLTADTAYAIADSGGYAEALEVGFTFCNERSGFGHNRSPLFTLALISLLGASGFCWFRARTLR